ncbi:MAG: DUF2530 domain-containing protein [Salinibacterium sp.]|nr:DUF2530 domain-containing protein [Salinibacterium sp.]
MRFWLKDSERRPDPAPVVTDDRAAFLVGSGLWVIALVAALLLAPQPWFGWTCVAGLAIGAIGLGWSIWRRKAQ